MRYLVMMIALSLLAGCGTSGGTAPMPPPPDLTWANGIYSGTLGDAILSPSGGILASTGTISVTIVNGALSGTLDYSWPIAAPDLPATETISLSFSGIIDSAGRVSMIAPSNTVIGPHGFPVADDWTINLEVNASHQLNVAVAQDVVRRELQDSGTLVWRGVLWTIASFAFTQTGWAG